MRQQDLTPARRRQLIACAPPHGHCKALLPPATPRTLTLSHEASASIQQASAALGRLHAATRLLPNTGLITRTLARREAVQSSQIEGTRTQLSELLEYEATRSLDGSNPDAQVTERYVIALDRGLQSLRTPDDGGITLELVHALHRTLMEDAAPHVNAGAWRDSQAWIGAGRIEDATFVPPPPNYIDECMRELERSMLRYERGDDEFWELSIVVRLALTHAQFETIHPFADGNGRVGRLLMPLMLAEAGYPALYLSGYLLRYRQAYYAALAGVQLREEWDNWIGFLCRAIVAACDTSIAIAEDMNLMAERWQAQLSDLRKDAAARKVPRLLLGHPIIGINELASLLGTSFQTASTAVELLVERGILHSPSPATRRGRVFRARELLDRLERD
ncbi:Fic family protein [Luteibacter sp.]|jgi:Fic family protein|uniref:Fic family protein n=1 Tax=Luteibacter sp. TaxID=1886636 RepID=UPI002F42FC7B